MPKSSFQHFYMETWLKAQGTAWKDLKKLKYSDDLKFRGEPTPKEYGDLDLRSTLPKNCFHAFTCAAFQQKIFLESKGCRMNVTMLHESMNASNDPKSSLQLLKVLLTTLTTRRSGAPRRFVSRQLGPEILNPSNQSNRSAGRAIDGIDC